MRYSNNKVQSLVYNCRASRHVSKNSKWRWRQAV